MADEQVLRDHAISHVLAAPTSAGLDDAIGGTALSRTFLPDLRLSEDIDLLTTQPRATVGPAIEEAVARGLQRSHGSTAWLPPLAATRGSQSSVLVVGDTVRIRVQLLRAEGYAAWPTELQQLGQRYGDAPPAALRTPTAAAFAGWKTATCSIARPRDLYDLWGLGRAGLIDAEAAQLFRTHGPTSGDVQPWMFTRTPSEADWAAALAHQGVVQVGPTEARDEVRERWARAAADAAG